MPRRQFLAATLATALASALPALGQDFPRKPVRIVVPFPPGGTPDLLARILGARLPQILGQQVIVDNRPGAGGNLAMELVARAPADGYTLVMGTIGTCALNAFLYPRLGFDVERDFAPVMLVGSIQNVLVVHPSVPATTVKELVALAKSRAGNPMTYGSSGFGSSIHVAGEWFQAQAGVDLRHVPYKGSALASTALMAGETDMMFDNLPSIAPHLAAGRVRALAVTGPKRSKLFPAVPTVREAGYPEFVMTPWFGLLAPAKTPAAVLARLNAAFNEALRDAQVAQRFAESDVEPGGGDGAGFAKLMRTETALWGRLIKEKNITAE
jgi:tripartite-type tricarboxylate transporter receptor subunit TctC